MADVLVEKQNLQDIANSIRAKNGLTTLYKPSEMSTAIDNIDVGVGDVFGNRYEDYGTGPSYTDIGKYTAGKNYIYFNKIEDKDLEATYLQEIIVSNVVTEEILMDADGITRSSFDYNNYHSYVYKSDINDNYFIVDFSDNNYGKLYSSNGTLITTITQDLGYCKIRVDNNRLFYYYNDTTNNVWRMEYLNMSTGVSTILLGFFNVGMKTGIPILDLEYIIYHSGDTSVVDDTKIFIAIGYCEGIKSGDYYTQYFNMYDYRFSDSYLNTILQTNWNETLYMSNVDVSFGLTNTNLLYIYYTQYKSPNSYSSSPSHSNVYSCNLPYSSYSSLGNIFHTTNWINDTRVLYYNNTPYRIDFRDREIRLYSLLDYSGIYIVLTTSTELQDIIDECSNSWYSECDLYITPDYNCILILFDNTNNKNYLVGLGIDFINLRANVITPIYKFEQSSQNSLSPFINYIDVEHPNLNNKINIVHQAYNLESLRYGRVTPRVVNNRIYLYNHLGSDYIKELVPYKIVEGTDDYDVIITTNNNKVDLLGYKNTLSNVQYNNCINLANNILGI